jgi:hypothetical protein
MRDNGIKSTYCAVSFVSHGLVPGEDSGVQCASMWDAYQRNHFSLEMSVFGARINPKIFLVLQYILWLRADQLESAPSSSEASNPTACS